jgi:outer membrane immunogenic protein
MSLRRRIVIASVIASLLPCAAGAMGIEKGVKAGVNLASFRGEFADLADAKTRAGFVGGGFVAFGFAPDLAVQVELLYTQKGAKFESVGMDDEGSPTGRTYDTFVKVDYLEVPVLLRGTLLRGAPVQPMYLVGPTAGINLGGTVESDGLHDADLDDLKSVDLGLVLGAGAGFKLGGRKATAEFRYTTGFTDIYDLVGNAESINSVFSLMAGIAF